jgi:dienelactone hydrolase
MQPAGQHVWNLIRRGRISAARVLAGLAEVFDPGTGCPVAWTPAPLTPVWSGFDDFGPSEGAPMQIRVWFPSFTSGGSLLRECGRFPLIVLVNGQCQNDTNPHLHWGPIATSLARSGYVVAAPNFGGGIDFNSQAHFNLLEAAVQWMRGTSPFASVTFPWEIGVAGHSYGGLLAMRYALRATIPPVSTIAILGSAIGEDTANLDLLRIRFNGFRLFCWGGRDTFGQVPDRDWSAAAGPGHAVRFGQANHWDFFPTSPPTPCAVGLSERGPCTDTWKLTTDVLTIFFGKYLHPHLGSLPLPHLPSSLIPPPLELTPAQAPFAAGHLEGFRELDAGASECAGASHWRTSFTTETGSASFP